MSGKQLHNGYPGNQDLTIRRFLRRRDSREYFKEGGWTKDPGEASSFADALEAAQICAQYGLRDVELALRFDQAGNDVFCTPVR